MPDKLILITAQKTRDAIGDRVGEPAGGSIADRGHSVLRGLGDGQAPTLLAGRHQVHPGALQHLMLRFLVKVPMESHRIGNSKSGSMFHQRIHPPTIADHIEMHVGHVVTQHRQGCQRVLDLLVRHQP
ncbi:Uncharacterised protein [Mycobacteroides abscessus subsp. abscessus]|nr:Uncharacterised protein [Mycobacteroides abscessus subsp. abscessus]